MKFLNILLILFLSVISIQSSAGLITGMVIGAALSNSESNNEKLSENDRTIRIPAKSVDCPNADLKNKTCKIYFSKYKNECLETNKKWFCETHRAINAKASDFPGGKVYNFQTYDHYYNATGFVVYTWDNFIKKYSGNEAKLDSYILLRSPYGKITNIILIYK